MAAGKGHARVSLAPKRKVPAQKRKHHDETTAPGAAAQSVWPLFQTLAFARTWTRRKGLLTSLLTQLPLEGM
jgi:hypothetical protein